MIIRRSLAVIAATLIVCACGPRVAKRENQRTTTPEERSDDQQRLAVADGATASLRLLETTDLHVNMEAFDYYKGAPVKDSGFVRTAALLRKKRADAVNSITIDNGDLIQGSPLGDWFQDKRDPKRDIHAVYKAMNLVGYDAANIGNHEFNYGLEYLEATLRGARFPYTSANVVRPDGKSLVNEYIRLERRVKLDDGTEADLTIGVIGFAPPQIMAWDRANLVGRLEAKDIVDTANAVVPRMKAEGVDIVIAVPHSGISAAERAGNDENAVYYLSQVPGIDAILSGHSHKVFPSKDYANIPNTSLDDGTINGVPVVMAGQWGSHVGIVDLSLKMANGKWGVTGGKGSTAAIMMKDETGAVIPDDETAVAADVREAVKDDHAATLAYLQTEVGSTEAPIHSYFSQIAPSAAVQLINDAQLWYARKAIDDGGAETAHLKGLPLLSAAAPLKAGFSPDNFTDVAAGKVTLRNVADLYVYPNTVRVVKLTGEQVIDWLEMSANMFAQIKAHDASEQNLLNDTSKGGFPAYNFDQIAGIAYEIDVTQPARFDGVGKLKNAEAHRIVNVRYNGQPIDLAAPFLVVTNNYRADSGKFPALDGTKNVLDPGRESREALRDYVESRGGALTVTVDQNWRILPVAGASNVIFRTGPAAADKAAELSGLVDEAGTQEGWLRYRMNW